LKPGDFEEKPSRRKQARTLRHHYWARGGTEGLFHFIPRLCSSIALRVARANAKTHCSGLGGGKSQAPAAKRRGSQEREGQPEKKVARPAGDEAGAGCERSVCAWEGGLRATIVRAAEMMMSAVCPLARPAQEGSTRRVEVFLPESPNGYRSGPSSKGPATRRGAGCRQNPRKPEKIRPRSCPSPRPGRQPQEVDQRREGRHRHPMEMNASDRIELVGARVVEPGSYSFQRLRTWRGFSFERASYS